MCTFLSFRCILFICSCFLSKYLSLCELFWYPSPDDGYWNRNVQCWLYIIINSPIWIMFFCYLHTVGFWSIFTFILSFRKNKYQIYSYTTSNTDDFKTIYIYENLFVFVYFLINRRVYLVSLGNPSFLNIFPGARDVLNTFELWTLCARSYLFVVYIFYLLLLSQQASITTWTILISKSWWWLQKPKSLMLTLHHNKFTYLDYVFLLSS